MESDSKAAAPFEEEMKTKLEIKILKLDLPTQIMLAVTMTSCANPELV